MAAPKECLGQAADVAELHVESLQKRYAFLQRVFGERRARAEEPEAAAGGGFPLSPAKDAALGAPLPSPNISKRSLTAERSS